MNQPLLSARDLSVNFEIGRKGLFGKPRLLRAVRGVDFDLMPGRTLGLVGESGSGKTTTAMAAIRLTPPTGGSVTFDGDDLLTLPPEAMRAHRRHLQVIFQDPYSSLNPRDRVGAIVREPLDLMDVGDPAGRDERVRELFRLVGLRPDQMTLFPHQFSGGQRQRISIARALATNPRLIVCDEPVSALDVAIQAQILNLLRRLQDEFGLSYLFISHDLGVVQFICDDIAVMYLGEIVEYADRPTLFAQPRHPYTAVLLDAAPSLARRKSAGYRRAGMVKGDLPSPMNLPRGCAFASRCPNAQALCRDEAPVLRALGDSRVACHFPLS
ncbi:MAG: ATP-binding cassette domain-containing protein [Rhodobacter sp.]|uniref:ABC transporter ATP-binding protein n=1 Tax=Pararhodobacter sp. TaxID=2127056 RepID=UPI001DC23963|nr:oligopeptide/dipeptide ABC transporter ATP-binding protein [Pararhodobacter sp.]MCB1346626.1 ATP-binding cassette domain-containing protein [Paracoccaceae bacterium]MCC0072771.1 ATP-binding cassette domain-containing protein [Rhodobacter sp.]HPD92089.1 ATP-binding cassette domain-containing protein [Pararhodobacter sp.]